ncbi:MAG: hypothetical protein NTY74_04440 [Ignavibacteriae bacterium]|nr:hypothetical protein [Ignavibacteriota bacterium]
MKLKKSIIERKIYFGLLLLSTIIIQLSSVVSFSQDKSDYVGTWKETVRLVIGIDAHESNTKLIIYENGNYKGVGKDIGTWEILADNKLKLLLSPSVTPKTYEENWDIFELIDNELILVSVGDKRKGEITEYTAKELKMDIRYSKIYSEKELLNQKIELADELISQNNYEEAIETLKYCISKDKSLEYTLNPKLLDATIKLADEKFNNNKFLESENLYKKALRLNPSDKSIEMKLISTFEKSSDEYKSNNKYPEAISKLNEVLKYDFSTGKKEEVSVKIAGLYALEGDTYKLKGDLLSALEAYKNSIKNHNNKTVQDKITKLNEKIENDKSREKDIEDAKYKLEIKVSLAADFNNKSESNYQSLFKNGIGFDLSAGYKVLPFFSFGIGYSAKFISCSDLTTMLINFNIDTVNVSNISGDAQMTKNSLSLFTKLGYFNGVVNPYVLLKTNYNFYSIDRLSFQRYLPNYGGYTTEGTEIKSGSYFSYSFGLGLRFGRDNFRFDICFINNQADGSWIFKKYSNYELNVGLMVIIKAF